MYNIEKNKALGINKFKLLICIFCFLILSFLDGHSQNIGINYDGLAPHSSALLDLRSKNRGLLIPRISLNSVTDGLTIPSPAHTLLIYNTNPAVDVGETFYYNEGDSINPHWVPFTFKYNAWHTIGNAGTTPGTGTGQNFLGTIDNNDFIIATTSTKRMWFDKNGGISAPTATITSLATGLSGLKITVDSLSNGMGIDLSSTSTKGKFNDASQMININKSGKNQGHNHVAIGVLSNIFTTGIDDAPSGMTFTRNYSGVFVAGLARFCVGVEGSVFDSVNFSADTNVQLLTGATFNVFAGDSNKNLASENKIIEAMSYGIVPKHTGLFINLTGGTTYNRGITVQTNSIGTSASHGISSVISGSGSSYHNYAGFFESEAETSDPLGSCFAIHAVAQGATTGVNCAGYFSAGNSASGKNYAIIVPPYDTSNYLRDGGWVGIGCMDPKRILHVDGTVRIGGTRNNGRLELYSYLNSRTTTLISGTPVNNVKFVLPVTNGAAGDVLSVSGVVGDTSVLGWTAPAASNSWSLTGNGSTTPGTNFLGTTDSKDFVIKTNNTERMHILSEGNVGISNANPAAKFVVNGGFVIQDSSDIITLTTDGLTITVGDRSYLRLSSNNSTSSNRTFILTNGRTTGQILVLEWTSTNEGELADGGNCKLASVWPATTNQLNDTLTLIWNGGSWVEISRSAN